MRIRAECSKSGCVNKDGNDGKDGTETTEILRQAQDDGVGAVPVVNGGKRGACPTIGGPNRDRISLLRGGAEDWGPGGEWGLVKSYHVDGSAVPKGGNGTKFDVASSGVVVVVTVNERVGQKAHVWVEKSDKTLGFSPF